MLGGEIMKIIIGTNIFGKSLKQDLALQTYATLKKKYSGIVDVYAFQFEDDTVEVPDGIVVSKSLKRSSQDFVIGGKKKAPLIRDLYDSCAEKNTDYFIFTNSDVMISNRLIDYILTEKYIAFGCSRMDIRPIKSLDESMIPYRYEVAGFDTFVMKNDWYLKNRNLIKDYFLGSIWYDTAMTTILKLYGQNDPFVNDYPVKCLHPHHGWGSGTPNPENDWNTKLYNTENKDVMDSWGWFYHNVLTKRTPSFYFFDLLPDEKKIEKEHFDKYLLKNEL